MPPEPDFNSPYFESPARTERLQLLLHLARNTDTPVYLRGPEGAGKTRLMTRLRQELQEERVVAWVDLAEPVKLVAAVIQQLGLPPEAADNWPAGLTQTLGPRTPLIVVDGADNLDPATRASLVVLADSGIRLILVGRGGGVDDWDVQFVDLPPFDAVESAAFLRGQAGIEAARISDEFVAASYEATHGWPGALLDVLHGLASGPSLSSPSQKSLGSEPERDRRSTAAVSKRAVPGRGRGFPWAWIGAGVVGVLLAAVLVFQDRINAVIAPPEAASSDEQPPVVPTEASQPWPAQTTDPASAMAQPAAVTGETSIPATEEAVLPVPDRSAEAADTSTSSPDVADAVDPLLTPLSELEDQRESEQTSPDSADPLDDVLKDALAAVEMQQQRVEQPQGAGTSAERTPSGPNRRADSPAVAEPPTIGAEIKDDATGAASAPTAPEARIEAPAVPEARIQAPAVPAVRIIEAPAAPDARIEAPTAPAARMENAAKPVDGPRAVPDPLASGSTADSPEGSKRPDDPVEAAEPVARGGPAPVEQRTAARPVVTRRDQEVQVRREDPKDGPAPVEDRTGAGRVVNPEVAKKAVGASTPERPSDGGAAEGGDAWLRTRRPQHFTLQLVGARDRSAVEKFAKVNRISPPYAIFRRTLDGADWFSLVAGDYPDRDAAIAARRQLPKSLQAAGVWPRTFESVQTAR